MASISSTLIDVAKTEDEYKYEMKAAQQDAQMHPGDVQRQALDNLRIEFDKRALAVLEDAKAESLYPPKTSADAEALTKKIQAATEDLSAEISDIEESNPSLAQDDPVAQLMSGGFYVFKDSSG